MHGIPSEALRAFQTYAESRNSFLQSIGRSGSCRDPLEELSELLVCCALPGTVRAPKRQKAYDFVCQDGRRVKVKHHANPGPTWVKPHHIRFLPETDDYALVCFEAMRLTVVVVFPRETLAKVCALLGNKHRHQDRTLRLTRPNLMAILESEELYLPLGVKIFRA